MKKRKMVLILSIFLLKACDKGVNLQDTPNNTAKELIATLNLEKTQPQASNFAYESFKELFADEFQENATKEKFNEFKNIIGYSTMSEYITCVPVKLQNGQGLIVYIVPSPTEEKYEVYDIVKMTEEVREFFFPE